MTNNAVVYVAWGDDFVALARKSLASLKKHTPDVKAYLFTDKMRDRGLFDHVETIKVYDSRPRTKASGILRSFQAVSEICVVYLDSDTLILGDISDLFKVAFYYDVAMAHAPFRLPKSKTKFELDCLTPALPAFNSGVIVYKKVHGNTHLFYAWEKRVVSEKADQFILSNLIHSGNYRVDITVLPPEYNARTGWPFCVQGEVKILHGTRNLDEVASVVNQKPGLIRVWMPGKGMIYK